MSIDRPVRTTRAIKATADDPDPWAPVISGILSVDVRAANGQLEEWLSAAATSAGATVRRLEEVGRMFALALKLRDKSRRDYEIFKVEHGIWLEERKSVARAQLEEEKREKKLTKQITVDMVTDAVRGAWPEESRIHETKLRDFQAAVHYCESLPEAVQTTGRALDSSIKLYGQLGATAPIRRERNDG